MGKGYKRKTRWRTLNIGAPPGEEDEEDGIRNGYTKGQENGTNSRNGQSVHKSGRTDSAGSTTSDYASDYASAASRSRRDDSGGSPSQPKIIFNENEYTRITTPRQDVLFKKGYLSRKKVWASTASTSATPSTTESQSASHSTADGSETTEDQQLLDCKENGSEDYSAMVEPGAQVAYGTFYDHASGYYYEYPVMVVGPGGGIPGPPMHNLLTAVPCGPVPLRPIEWVNPAFVPKIGDQQYCVMDYQAAHLAQYPTLVDENGVPLTVPPENTNGCEEACFEDGTGSASWSGSVADEEHNEDEQQQSAQTEKQNGTTESNGSNALPEEEEEAPETTVNSEVYLENALAQQLHVTHVAVPPVPQPYMYPGHYMFGPSLVNVNGVTIQSGPMVRNTGVSGAPTNTGACAKRRKKKKLSKRNARRRVGPGNPENEEQEEEEYSSESENPTASLVPSTVSTEQSTASAASTEPITVEKSIPATPSVSHKPLNPECQEFRPTHESRIVPPTIDAEPSSSLSNSDPSPSAESSENNQPEISEENHLEPHISDIPKIPTDENLPKRQQEEELEGAPVEFAAEVFANVTTIAERALAPRNVVEGTPIQTEIGLDATSLNFQEIVETTNSPLSIDSRIPVSDEEIVPNGKKSDSTDENPRKDLQRGSRSVSPGMINRTTTPINAMSQRLPESYESLVIRGSSSSSSSSTAAQQQSTVRNRKYSSKTPKFVREATPGPDLDVTQLQSQIQQSSSEPEESIRMKIIKSEINKSAQDSTRIPVGFDESIATGVEAIEVELQSYSCSLTNSKREANAEDSGVESQRLSSEHPITDAVTEWLQRANSPELFVTSTMVSESEPEDDELEDAEPSKNLQGNPMPALSVESSDVIEESRSASCGKFAKIIDGTENNNNDDNNIDRMKLNNDKTQKPRNRKDKIIDNDEFCKFAEKDSVAGMRVAKNSRIAERSRRSKSRELPIENVEVKIRRIADDDEGIVEDEEMSVKTYEKGEIVVSIDGKVLPVNEYETILVMNQRIEDDCNDTPKFRTITCEKSRDDNEENERNSIGSIEEPDVLECWEVETVEPVSTPKKIHNGGKSENGEADENDFYIDKEAVEIVRKYYRLEAMRDSGTSVTSVDDCSNSSNNSMPKSPESLCSRYFNDTGIPVDEAVEVYESFYTDKKPSYLIDYGSKIRENGTLLFRRDNERDGALPCKAACCNIQ